MIWDEWPQRWQTTLKACQSLGGETGEFLMEPPATQDEIIAVERELGIVLPKAFREVLLKFSKHVEFYWQLPDQKEPSEELQGIFSGECTWNLNELVQSEETHRSWLQNCFSDPTDPYDAVWYEKLAFLMVANGDELTIDLTPSENQSVVYLSHDGEDSNGHKLGDNFIDFMDRWIRLGCPGAEDWQWRPFTHNLTSLLDPECETAKKWRGWFGLKF